MLSPQEFREKAQAALDKLKETAMDTTDEAKKKLLGTGMARQAADAITKRKKDIDSVME